ncbi:YhgE/Pip domain-containing protein [Floricoccus penangensis]|uniref:YhgE/Pip domain-containing protein n=1 Tax=Floricoccus penangensis TaxID=1859475 RepID=UPI00203B681B|nr:YhgE/Pip domain-containing protein [Floricoccus penangensis]URZ88015.1 YhgE/Pip domain-containing protein [Floricoccus penangensis]
MIKEEFKKIRSNKLLLATVVVISLLPIMYAGVFLKSIWDPYGHMDNLPVAVVNEDKSVDFQGKKLDVGDQVVNNLKSNKSLDWNFVSAKDAKDGLKDRKYYMIVTIPENFSENAATVLDPDPQKLDLKYETNPGVNFLGEVVSDTAMTQLKAQVGESVSDSYVKAIFSTLKGVGNGMSQAADGAKKINDGTNKVNDGVNQLNEKVPTLASGVNQLDSGAGQLNSGIQQYTAGVSQVASGQNQLNEGINQLSGKVPALASGVSQLDSGADQLNTGVQQYTAGVGQVATGINDLNNKIPELEKGIEELKTGSVGLSDSLNGIPDDVVNNKDNLKEYINGVNQYLNTVNSVLNSMDTSNLSALDNLSALKTNLESVGSDLQSIGGNLKSINDGLANANAEDVQSNATAVVAALKSSGVELNNEQMAAIGGALAKNAQSSKANSLIIEQLGNANSNLQNAGATMKAVSGSSNIDVSGIKSSVEKLPELKSVTAQLNEGSKTATPGLNSIVDGMVDIKTQAAPGAKKIADGLTKLNGNIPALASGVSQLQAGAQQLNEKSSDLNDGSNKLSNGLNQLNGNIPALTNGAQQLVDGSNKLVNGTSTLDGKSGDLNSGSSKLANGLTELNGNVPALTNGVSQLLGGTSQLVTGTGQLSSKLQTGSQAIKKVNLTDKNANMIASPDKTTQSKYSEVPNYGHALAPYFMSVSLYVGALVFNFAYPIRKVANRKKATATNWFSSKVAVGGLVATVMALVIGVVMQMIGLKVDNQFEYFAMLLITSWAYMFLVMFLAMTFDNPGRFIAMILLVLQLGSAGGVFPMEIISKFYNVIHPYVPMTYSIYGLRQAISGGLGNHMFTSSFFILLVTAAAFIGLLYLSMKHLFKKGMAGYSQLNDNQKLMDDNYNNQSSYTLW